MIYHFYQHLRGTLADTWGDAQVLEFDLLSTFANTQCQKSPLSIVIRERFQPCQSNLKPAPS
jgi:hypothetical protein